MFTLDQVVPWGRSFDEYRSMFGLTDADLSLKILGCADGPASFNAEATRRGYDVRSCDPLYEYGAEQIRRRIHDTYDRIIEQTRRNADEFVWTTIRNVDELGRTRMEAMLNFLGDYEAGRQQGRYIAAELPALPFSDGAFGVALCSHFLFLYTDQLSETFHHAAMSELCRVAHDVRVFPLLALGAGTSSYVEPVRERLRQAGHEVSIMDVPYEFQRGGNQMMKIVRRT
jgi:hypothetical protein